MEDLKIGVEALIFAFFSFLAWRCRRRKRFAALYAWARIVEERVYENPAGGKLSWNASKLARTLEEMTETGILTADFDALYEECFAKSGEWDPEENVVLVSAARGSGKMLRRRTFAEVFLRKEA